MDCKTAQDQIELYLDDELTLSDKREFEAHIEYCPDCLASLESLKAIGAALRTHAVNDAPPQLKNNVRTALRDIAGEDDNLTKWAPWLSLSGGGFALAAAIIWGTLTVNLGTIAATDISDEIVAAHIRSMLVDHALDVRSANTHTVKPWFTGKLDFSPVLKDLSAAGFLLAGGRLEYIKSKTGAALVYKRREHLINVFTIHSGALPASFSHSQEKGYNIIHWSSSGLEHWIVSDLNVKELKQFTNLYTEPDKASSF